MDSRASFSFIMALFLSAVPSGCAPTWQTSPLAERQEVQRDSLSYGMVNAKVEKGVTRQDEIIHLFGPPNITTTTADGTEVWVYDKISSESQHDGWSETGRFDAFFTLGLAGVSGGKAGTKYGTARSTTTRTLTVIINFDKEDRVKDYSARATQF